MIRRFKKPLQSLSFPKLRRVFLTADARPKRCVCGRHPTGKMKKTDVTQATCWHKQQKEPWARLTDRVSKTERFVSEFHNLSNNKDLTVDHS